MGYKNKHKDLITNHYTNTYVEDERFNTNSHKIEFTTTMKYIHKYAKNGCKILEVGAGTGAYSVPLAKEGYNVTAVDLTPSNIDILKSKIGGMDNITAMVGDALDLSQFADETFDVVLNLGPLYHLFNQKDKDRAIAESIRVCKKGGIAMFAYISHGSIVWGYGVRKNSMPNIIKCMDKKGNFIDIPDELFVSHNVDDFKGFFKKTDTTYITNVATDGLFSTMRDYIDGTMNEKDYESLINWHLLTCERPDMQGVSGHLLYICKKNK